MPIRSDILRPALVSFALMTALTGIAYPLAVTGVARAAMPAEASGSILMQQGRAVGSSLIGQPFDGPGYFWGRISATAPSAYNAGASAGSNLGPMHPALVTAVEARLKALRDADPGNGAPVPVDLVTGSGSGLDPHISPAAAAYQVARVARARGVDEAVVRGFVAEHTRSRQLGVLGEPTVNVLTLNLALDVAAPAAR